jgi:exonuclease III
MIEKNPLKIFHQNIRGLKEKINELMISFLNEEPSVICLTEHHLTDCKMDASHIPKYKLGASYCRKKSKNGGGGHAYLFKKTKTSLL